MRISRLGWVAVLAVSCVVLPGLAAELGDPAPALKVEKWIKGGPVDLAGGKDRNIYVVEFWATWCKPCRASIPHLTELQAKYKDKSVVVVGVSVDEAKKRKTRKDVEPFVETMGENMMYAVALDTEDAATNKAYMDAFKVDGIPTAFVVDKAGRLVWLGHPDDVAEVLDAVLAGKWDLEKAKKEDKERQTLAEKREQAQKALSKYFELAASEEKPANLEQVGEQTLAAAGKDAMLLNTLAWTILDTPAIKHRDLKFALKVAKAAYDACDGKDAAIVDTYARALWDNGQKKEGLEYQRKAVQAAKSAKEVDQEMVGELQETLKKYEAEAGK